MSSLKSLTISRSDIASSHNVLSLVSRVGQLISLAEMSLSKFTRRDALWRYLLPFALPLTFRTHLLSDLRPYTCLYPGCDRYDQLFETREKWMAHELSHRYEWHRDDASVLVFSTEEKFKDHLLRDHDDPVTQHQVHFLIDTHKRPSLFPFLWCPFCNTPDELDLRNIKDLYKINRDTYIHLARSERLQKHISIHLLNLSTLAWLVSDGDCEDSVGYGPTDSNSAYRGRSENLSHTRSPFPSEAKMSI